MSISFTPGFVLSIVRASRIVALGGYCVLDGGGQMPHRYQQAILVSRAVERFEREYEAFVNGDNKLSTVRKYHRLLLEALHDFDRSDELAEGQLSVITALWVETQVAVSSGLNPEGERGDPL